MWMVYGWYSCIVKTIFSALCGLAFLVRAHREQPMVKLKGVARLTSPATVSSVEYGMASPGSACWKGFLLLSFVSIAVEIYNDVDTSTEIRFNQTGCRPKVVENLFAFTMTSQFSVVFRSMQKTWYFPVADGASHFADNGFTYFKDQASEKAATIGYDLVAMKNVSIDGSRISGWMIRGTVILKSPAPVASAARVLQAQMD